MFPFIGECFGNPSSAHALGRACKAAVVQARGRVAALLGCSPEEVVFVASGSEADNHAILASVRRLTSGRRANIHIHMYVAHISNETREENVPAVVARAPVKEERGLT